MLSLRHILNFLVEFNLKIPEFKVGGHAKILKYNNMLSRGYKSNWTKCFVI